MPLGEKVMGSRETYVPRFGTYVSKRETYVPKFGIYVSRLGI